MLKKRHLRLIIIQDIADKCIWKQKNVQNFKDFDVLSNDFHFWVVGSLCSLRLFKTESQTI